MEGGSRAATLLRTVIHHARGGAALLVQRVARGLSRQPTGFD
jgi:hypothetical protein